MLPESAPIIYDWKQRIAEESSEKRLIGEDREELIRLRKEVKKCRIEKEILRSPLGEKGQRLLCERNEVKFKAIAQWTLNYPVIDLCSALRVSISAYYHWRRKPAQLISEQELSLYREAKRLFHQTRSSMGYVRLCRALNQSGFKVMLYRRIY